MRYLLDTDTCIYLINRRPTSIITRLQRLQYGDVGMSLVTYYELVYGAWKSRHRQQNMVALQEMTDRVPIQALNAEAAMQYGKLRCELEEKGTPIGPYDLMIAAHALALDLTLVTNNVREFSRVRGLRLENWAG